MALTGTGYETFVVKALDYDTGGFPQSWAKLMATRHALSKYPDCGYVWMLDQNALIVDPKKSLEELVLDGKTLGDMLLRGVAVVPKSIIKTFSHVRGEDMGFIISQDREGLVTDSMIIKNGDWAKFFLEKWLNPLYRTYNFEKAERHALVSTQRRLRLPIPPLTNWE
jgi:mannan polymerase II complex MNN11 subunit